MIPTMNIATAWLSEIWPYIVVVTKNLMTAIIIIWSMPMTGLVVSLNAFYRVYLKVASEEESWVNLAGITFRTLWSVRIAFKNNPFWVGISFAKNGSTHSMVPSFWSECGCAPPSPDVRESVMSLDVDVVEEESVVDEPVLNLLGVCV